MALGWEEILRRADRDAPGFRKGFLTAVENARRGADVPALRQFLSRRQYDKAAALVEDAWKGAAVGWQAQLGRDTLALVDDVGAAAYESFAVGGSFELINPAAVDWARTEAATLVRNVTTQQVEAIRTIVASASSGNLTITESARRLRGVVGLDPRRAAALDAFRAREAADLAKRTKSMTAAATARLAARAEKRSERYAARLLKQRTMTIARTETMSAANEGLMVAWRQAVRNGKFPPGMVKRWVTTPDDRRCLEICMPMHGVKAELNAPFDVPKVGSVMRPPAHPNCRCVLTMVSLKKGERATGVPVISSPAGFLPPRATRVLKPSTGVSASEISAAVEVPGPPGSGYTIRGPYKNKASARGMIIHGMVPKESTVHPLPDGTWEIHIPISTATPPITPPPIAPPTPPITARVVADRIFNASLLNEVEAEIWSGNVTAEVESVLRADIAASFDVSASWTRVQRRNVTRALLGDPSPVTVSRYMTAAREIEDELSGWRMLHMDATERWLARDFVGDDATRNAVKMLLRDDTLGESSLTEVMRRAAGYKVPPASANMAIESLDSFMGRGMVAAPETHLDMLRTLKRFYSHRLSATRLAELDRRLSVWTLPTTPPITPPVAPVPPTGGPFAPGTYTVRGPYKNKASARGMILHGSVPKDSVAVLRDDGLWEIHIPIKGAVPTPPVLPPTPPVAPPPPPPPVAPPITPPVAPPVAPGLPTYTVRGPYKNKGSAVGMLRSKSIPKGATVHQRPDGLWEIHIPTGAPAVPLPPNISTAPFWKTLDEAKEAPFTAATDSALRRKETLAAVEHAMTDMRESFEGLEQLQLPHLTLWDESGIFGHRVGYTKAKGVVGIHWSMFGRIELAAKRTRIASVGSVDWALGSTHSVMGGVGAVEDTFRHEVGHYFEDIILKAKTAVGPHGTATTARDEWRALVGARFGARRKKLAKGVSHYAGTNEKELFAESFSIYTSKAYGTMSKFSDAGGPKLIKLPDEIHAFMEKWVGVRRVQDAAPVAKAAGAIVDKSHRIYNVVKSEDGLTYSLVRSGTEVGHLRLDYSGYVQSLFVDPAVRRQNIASELIKFVEKDRGATVAMPTTATTKEGRAFLDARAELDRVRARTTFLDELVKNKPASATRLGSNEGYQTVDGWGNKWYVKVYSDAEQARGEHLANEIYRSLGFGAPESVIGRTSDGKFLYASKWFTGAEEIGKLPGGLTTDRANKILDSFLTDVLTSNWDAVGSGLNNVVRLPGGGIARIDSGGTFFFRAKAGRKDLGALDKITEWDGYFDKNPDYHNVFTTAGYDSADALGDRLKSQFRELEVRLGTADARKRLLQKAFESTGIPKDELDKVIKSYDDLITKRLKLIGERVTEATKPKPIPKPAAPWVGGEADTRFTVEQALALVGQRVSPAQIAAEKEMLRWCKAQGWSDAEIAKATANLRQTIDNAHLCINVETENFIKVLKDGRFKSQFETKSSGGCFSPSHRNNVERGLFNTPDDVKWDPKQRPIYGSLQSDPYTHYNNTANSYGDITVRIRNGVRNRVTGMGGDSFGATSGTQCAPLSNPSLRMLFTTKRHGITSRAVKDINDIASGYFEVQYHGGLHVEDIAEVIIGPKGSWTDDAARQRLVAALQQAGIPFRQL